jgi:hypothetical protein
MTKFACKVEFDLPEGVTPAEAQEYVLDCLQSMGGNLMPAEPMSRFGWVRHRLKVTRLRAPKKKA